MIIKNVIYIYIVYIETTKSLNNENSIWNDISKKRLSSDSLYVWITYKYANTQNNKVHFNRKYPTSYSLLNKLNNKIVPYYYGLIHSCDDNKTSKT